MYGMTNSGNLFDYELIDFLLQVGFIKYQYHVSIYYKYVTEGTRIVVLYYDDDCVYWYTYEALGKWFVDALGKIFHVNS